MVVSVSCMLPLCFLTGGIGAPAGVVSPEPPPSPPQSEWAFVDALAAPLTWNPHWERTEKKAGEASLLEGVRIEPGFPDPDSVLETAYQDLRAFFESVGLPINGPYRITTEQVSTQRFETFRLAVSENECRIQAGDTEGIRRGIFFLEDQLMGAEGPFLPLGQIERAPFIHTRISRCFFGPIKRPPKNKDELLDDVDYYPDGYLNRIAHDGVNGLWLTIEFKDICKTSLTSVIDPDRDRRLEKLRKTVAKCRRYGIKVFVFCIEPRVMSPDNPLLKDHPELGSKAFSGSSLLFCPFSDAAQTYLYEAVHDIFTQVPNLGGLINISFGERSTTCLSAADENWRVACPVCAEKAPGEILRASLSAMQRGMHAANPDAKLISWLYVPGNGTGLQRSTEPLVDIARRTPSGVICQYNFESDGMKMQLGKERHAGDYWLSYIGPSDIFKSIAAAAGEAGVALGAKLQACNSFEASTVPYIPVPGNLYQKYREMRRLGVTSVMQCWYMGNMPSVMHRAAASVLPFAPEGITEDEFLMELARRDWGPAHAERVVRAWRRFAEAYDNYPITNAFQYYGPITDGVVWPLHLRPVHKNLSPVWIQEFPPSGDRIGECFSGNHTLEEMLELCKRMSDTWQAGLDDLLELQPLCANDVERQRDITVAQALGIQFRTGYNILHFYDLRERLLYDSAAPKAGLLEELRAIAEEEIENSAKMAALCEMNPFLGFQAEAEGYTYSPAELRWRAERLRDMLQTEFAEAAQAIAAGQNVFPEESGLAEGPLSYRCQRAPDTFAATWQDDEAWESLPVASAPAARFAWSWRAAHDGKFLYVSADCPPTEQWRPVSVSVAIEPTHIYPRRTFRGDVHGNRTARLGWLVPDSPWELVASNVGGRQIFRLRIPMDAFRGEADASRPMRINVEIAALSPDNKNHVVESWAHPSEKPVQPRLGYGADDPAKMGWLRLE
ncbi:MAG TPA: hypothetical protein PLM14_03035 [Candidatus Hydrogenedentes bacterium]|nr:hypothetical protein [Candidatus Hydrogenedentota bacterium]